MRKFLWAATALATLATGAAWAQDESPVTANISLTSKYKYRGQDQGDPEKTFNPAIQGGFDFSMAGFYVGNWNSSVGFGGGTEVDLYGGYKGEIPGGVGYDVGVLTYVYPATGGSAFNTTELYGGFSYSIATAKLSYVLTDKYFGAVDSRGTVYLDLGANVPLAPGLTLNGHVGYTRLASDSTYGPNYYDYKVGATYEIGHGFSVAGAVAGASKKSEYGDINKARLIATVTKSM